MTPTCTGDTAPAPSAVDVPAVLRRAGADVVDLALLERVLAGLDRL